MKDTVLWIWLSLSATPDSATIPRLLEHTKDINEIYSMRERDLAKILTRPSADKTLLCNKDLSEAERILEICEEKRIGIVAYNDERYPERLREIPTPPVLLYYLGSFPDFSRGFYVSVVGTRSLSDYGRRTAYKLSYDLATSGATVVSGMAAGIDGVAHAGALAAGKSTVAVLGTGIDLVFPALHETLRNSIEESGAVISEYPPGFSGTKYTFPQRNRIISGLSSATIVVEGRERSGAMITARHAKKQGRAVYAVPGQIGDKNSEASTALLKNGARLVTSAEDIIRDFGNAAGSCLNPHLLTDRPLVSLQSALTEYRIAAVCSSDGFFDPPRPKRKAAVSNASAETELKPAVSPKPQEAVSEKARELKAPTAGGGFDKSAMLIYQRIPIDGGCKVEELVDENTPLRLVMSSLLKLEVLSMIKMLPGERVVRKSK